VSRLCALHPAFVIQTGAGCPACIDPTLADSRLARLAPVLSYEDEQAARLKAERRGVVLPFRETR
jgi:hypothetical protein